MLSRLCRRLFLQTLVTAREASRLRFFANHAPLADGRAFAAYLAPSRKIEWVLYAKRPFAGPEACLPISPATPHRVPIANSRPIAFDDNGVTFRWKDYRV
jgi:hypothetical protein